MSKIRYIAFILFVCFDAFGASWPADILPSENKFYNREPRPRNISRGLKRAIHHTNSATIHATLDAMILGKNDDFFTFYVVSKPQEINSWFQVQDLHRLHVNIYPADVYDGGSQSESYISVRIEGKMNDIVPELEKNIGKIQYVKSDPVDWFDLLPRDFQRAVVALLRSESSKLRALVPYLKVLKEGYVAYKVKRNNHRILNDGVDSESQN